MEREYKTVREIKEHGDAAVGKMIRELVTEENVEKWYASPRNKGWLGNAIEKDWFGLLNNSRPEADFTNLGVELKSAGLKYFTRDKAWAAKERLVLNIFDFNKEYKYDFQTSSFLKKSNLVQLMLYKYKPVTFFEFEGVEYPVYPDFFMTHSILFNLYDIIEEDWAIIENDWNIIMDMIRKGKAHEISEGMTQYLGAVTKGSKTELNQTTQPFSDKKAHRRAFSLKPAYMKEITKRIVDGKLKSSTTYSTYQNDYTEFHDKVAEKQLSAEEYLYDDLPDLKDSTIHGYRKKAYQKLHEVVDDNEKDTEEHIIKNPSELKNHTFEELILNKFKPFYNMDKFSLAKEFGITIPKKNDKASSRLIAQKMFNLDGGIEETDEFKKAGIALKTIKVKFHQRTKPTNKRMTDQAFKLESDVSFIKDISNLDWEETRVYDYLSTTKFLLIVFEITKTGEVFRGAKFWYMPEDILMGPVKDTWEKNKKILDNGVELKFQPVMKSAKNKKGYQINNNLLSQATGPQILHMRPSAKEAHYHESSHSDRLPSPAIWINRPEEMNHLLTDHFMVKQAFWLNKDYMYQQVKEFFE